MKIIGKKVLGLFVVMFLTVATYANGIVTYADGATAEKSKTEGVFNFNFDSDYTVDDINKSAKYYTSYFTVEPITSPSGTAVKIKLVEDNAMSRRVVARFFISMEVKEIMVEGKAVTVDDFIANYVMN